MMRSEQDWKEELTGERKFPTPSVCREWVQSYFSQEKMAENYLKLYELVSSGHSLHDQEPKTLISAEAISGKYE